jgi:hypothetical protein
MFCSIQRDVQIEEGELTMFVMEMPDIPSKYAKVIPVQASHSPETKATYERTIGICAPIDYPPNAPQRPCKT